MRGITVHRLDCPNILNAQMGRVVQVSWGRPSGKLYTARLRAEALDRSDLIRDAAQAIGLEGGSIHGIKATTVGNSLMRMKIELKVKDVEHLYSIVAKLNNIKEMLEHQNAVARGHARARHDGRGCGQPQRARASDDKHGHGANHRAWCRPLPPPLFALGQYWLHHIQSATARPHQHLP